jgi:GxxExxY protein
MEQTEGLGLAKLAWSDRTEKIIGAAIEVHRHLGPGLLESVYEHCLCRELDMRAIPFERQVEVPVFHKGEHVDGTYRMDLVVSGEVVVELKAVDRMIDVFEAQLPSYMRLTKKPVGLLINFNVPVLTKGITRRVL